MKPYTTLFLQIFIVISLLEACQKNHGAAGPNYTSHMGGARKWHGSFYYSASGPHFPTPVNEFYYYPDTTFALTIINDTAICLAADTFTYMRTDTVGQAYYFGTAWYYYMYQLGTGIVYFYAKDSLVFCNGDIHATSDSWVMRNLRWTF